MATVPATANPAVIKYLIQGSFINASNNPDKAACFILSIADPNVLKSSSIIFISILTIPIIALTAHALAEHREQAEEAGANDFDTKPIEMPRLLEKIEKLLP